MSQITVSIPDELSSRIRRAVADGGYQSISAFIAEAVKQKFAGTTELDYWTRVGLVMQLENNKLLSALTKDTPALKDGEWHSEQTYDILTEGYEHDYDELFQYVYKDGLSGAGSKFVVNVLAVYEDLQWSCRENGEPDTAREVLFSGFDGNHDTGLLGYVRYLVKNRRFAHVKTVDNDYNSHGMNPDYRAMLSRYHDVRAAVGDRHKALTKEQIAEVIG